MNSNSFSKYLNESNNEFDLDFFVELAKQTKSAKEFIKKVHKIANVPPEVTREFREKYGYKGKKELSPEEAAEKFWEIHHKK